MLSFISEILMTSYVYLKMPKKRENFWSLQQDFDQNKLEEEMRKRKERVEKWREEQRKRAIVNIGEIKKELEEMKQGKKWSLEDDDGKGTKWNISERKMI